MPYEVAFRKVVPLLNSDEYINDCCVGGDVVSAWFEPRVRALYQKVETNQEDWGWFLWFRHDDTRLAIDIFTDDPELGEFRIHLTSRRPKWFFLSEVVDAPELEALRDLVAHRLAEVGAEKVSIRKVDSEYA